MSPKAHQQELGAALQPAGTEAAALAPAVMLDITEPDKWQMAVRVHLERLSVVEREKWCQGFALINQMAQLFTREGIKGHYAEYCIVCGDPFKDGKPAGDAQYYDETRQLIVVHYCKPHEVSDAMKICSMKEESIARAEERANKAARQAQIDARASNAAKARQAAAEMRASMQVSQE